ncbi:MAG: DUF2330 domain-containing protein [Planctomycetes bacterium]|nr:DUF2330 domain-containing protein [Planctomycetota bacterium]
MRNKLTNTLLIAIAASLIASAASADPCGMVPPIWTGPGPAIERVGLQKTYVFYKDGVETFAVRPGFQGKVDNFGMLIPVPSVPAIKKIGDDTFAHIAAAIDPPEIEVYVGDYGWGGMPMEDAARPTAATRDEAGLRYRNEDVVNVVKEEAMGMYQVVVLDAGSARALKLWMEEHKYTYPQGMDEVCQDYVNAGWMFVAVKAKVGQKEGVNPKPGMHEDDVNPDRPQGSVFDGHVQGMAFRFKSDKLVVPMRLSSYNAGELHNVLYILSDDPSAVEDIPLELVKRQVSGEQLYLNLTQPLPLRIYGGGYDDIPEWQRAGLATQRDPKHSNGLARELFAADLLAARTGELTLMFEEKEKELLNISERLGLRGEEIDRLHRAALETEREHELNAVLMDLLDMTLTVVDGDFQRDVLRRDNLHFVSYQMPAKINNPETYHAPTFTARPVNNDDWRGKALIWVDQDRHEAALEVARMLKDKSLPERKEAMAAAEAQGTDIFNPLGRPTMPASEGSSLPWVIAAISALLALGIGVGVGVKLRKGAGAGAILLTLGFAFAAGTTSIKAKDVAAPPDVDPETQALLAQLHDAGKASAAVDKLVAQGEKSVPGLIVMAFTSEQPAPQGWAIAALAEIGGEGVDRKLSVLHEDTTKSELVRTWAAAARVQLTSDTKQLVELARMASSMPALGRPIAKKLVEGGGDNSAEALIGLSLTVPSLTTALQPAIMELSAEDLARAMTTAHEQNVRYYAASYLGGKFQAGDKTVPQAVIDVYAWNKDAKKAPWDGGALYVPGINWSKEDGSALVRNLLEWGVWCERKEKTNEFGQIHNNLCSLGLAQAVGYQINWNNRDITGWLVTCGRALGKGVIEELLKSQGVEEEKRYKDVLDQLK